MKSKTYEKELIVNKTHLDHLKHVNNVQYLQWVQDIAEEHWNSNTSSKIKELYAWVVLNHFIEYKNPAFDEDILIIKTWVEKYHGAKSERHTEIKLKSNNKIIVAAKTLWCLLHKETLRPQRISEEISTLF